MQKMFQSATLKLTASYLAIAMAITMAFSLVIYQINYREINFRLQSLQHSIIDSVNAPAPLSSYLQTYITGPDSPLVQESRKASSQMILSLIYINLVVLITGGLGAYFLARRTLRPLEEAHEAQSRFTSDASHELRTPLAAMKAEIEVNLRNPSLDATETRELLESSLEEVNKLITLSQTLLQLSRLDGDKLDMTVVDLPSTLTYILKRYPQHKKRFKITVRKRASTLANQSSITELMGILIDNALKYSPAGSPIVIRIFEQRGTIGFEVKNQGKPIPQDKLDRIFDRFYRLDTSRTNSSQNGYGLGLSIAKKIAEVHHGSITVSSSKTSTAFTFFLPIVKKSYKKTQQ